MPIEEIRVGQLFCLDHKDHKHYGYITGTNPLMAVFYNSLSFKPQPLDADQECIVPISAFEVVISFVFIKGTITQCEDIGMEDTHFYVHSIDGKSFSVIEFAMLDEPMKSTVLSLLERQKKEGEE